jgi:cysteinyl-tRNA synthetase, unknown class
LSATNEMTAFMDVAVNNGLIVLATDYCSTKINVDDSYSKNSAKSYISFAADHRELDNVPAYPIEPYNMNSADINTFSDAKNFLYLINPVSSDKTAFLDLLGDTSHDVIIMDLFFDGTALTNSEINSLKTKKNGGKRLVIAYLSIGEAEDYRYYWRSAWANNPPSWLVEENPDWPGNYKVAYWVKSWQNIIYGYNTSYLKKITDASFDGVYLDIIDAYEYFESL